MHYARASCKYHLYLHFADFFFLVTKFPATNNSAQIARVFGLSPRSCVKRQLMFHLPVTLWVAPMLSSRAVTPKHIPDISWQNIYLLLWLPSYPSWNITLSTLSIMMHTQISAYTIISLHFESPDTPIRWQPWTQRKDRGNKMYNPGARNRQPKR